MKAKFSTLCVAAMLIVCAGFASIRRVGYTGNPRNGTDYTNFKDAHDASANNDTIQIYGVNASGTVTKPLVIIGFGYNFDVNRGFQVVRTDAPSYAILDFSGGSSGSIVSGVSGTFSIYDKNGTHTAISNITFRRCQGNFYFHNEASYGPINNIKIISSALFFGGMYGNAANDFPVTNLQIYNCIFGYGTGFTLFKKNTTAFIINCVIASPKVSGANGSMRSNDANVLVKNSILSEF